MLATSGPVPPLAAATGGDPTANAFLFSPHLAAAIFAQPECVASVWPAFDDLRAAAHATKPARLRLVVSALVAEARLVFGACLSLARGTPVPSACAATRPGAALHQWISTLLVHGSPPSPLGVALVVRAMSVPPRTALARSGSGPMVGGAHPHGTV